MTQSLLEVRGLNVSFGGGANAVHAVRDVSFSIQAGERFALVGESGSGKSVTALSVLRLVADANTSGEILWAGENLLDKSERQMRGIRGADIAMIFQEPMTALNPLYPIGRQIVEAIELHEGLPLQAAEKRAIALLERTGIPAAGQKYYSYPHQLSGGQRQRAMIAMALLFTPDLVIMDEPTSALDVVAQRSLMSQIKQLQEKLGFAVIFVTHDMSLVTHYSDRLAVMYGGQIAEASVTQLLFDQPLHPYSKGLLDAFPSIRGPRRVLTGIPGTPPDLAHPPAGCRFQPRCPVAMAVCATREPDLYDVRASKVRCLLYDPTIAAPEARAQ